MDIVCKRLAELHPVRALDMATGAGGFARSLASCLGSYGEILATDSSEPAVEAAMRNLEDLPAVKAELADARALPYADEAFDLAAIANSLHHFEDPSHVIAEALRVLRPEGLFIVFEMHREAHTEPELNHVRLHRFWGEVDSAGGLYHAETFERARFRELLTLSAFSKTSWDEVPSPAGDPKDPELLAEVEKTFGLYRKKIAALEDPLLRGRFEGDALRLEGLIRSHGFRSAPSIFFIGYKT